MPIGGQETGGLFDVRSAIFGKGRADLPKLVKVRGAHAVPFGSRSSVICGSRSASGREPSANPAEAVFAAPLRTYRSRSCSLSRPRSRRRSAARRAAFWLADKASGAAWALGHGLLHVFDDGYIVTSTFR